MALESGWTLTRLDAPSSAPALPETIAATVPGCVHLDLMEAGLIADPYLDVNEISQDWIGRSAWRYRTQFEGFGETGEEIDLSCLGLDTAATITLNGKTVGKTRNMNRSYRFPLAAFIGEGTNELVVDFQSAYAHGEEVRGELGAAADIPANYPGPGHLIRKMACNFGWDWGPSLVTAGAWKPVLIERWSTARIDAVRPQITIQGATGRVRVDIDIAWADAAETDALLQITIAGQTVQVPVLRGQRSAVLEARVENPRIWWPHGLGDQPLYPLAVTLLSADETVLDGWDRKVGFRSVRLDTAPDEIGSAFALVVNDVPVFVRGANWIPDDCFLPRVTPDRYRERIGQARDANMNLLRVWGGGIFETDAFYEACDEAGLMVWQDFLFACAAYPEEEPVRGEVEAEAREAIVRLMPYPSLVLWNGNNENIWGYFDWGWRDVLGNRAWGAGYYLDLLPRLVAELDPTRPYWAGSPYSGSMDIPPNADEHGCKHIWDVWNDVGYEVYRDYIPRFCSEFGWQAPPTFATLKQAVREDHPASASPGVLHHQKATLGNDRLLRGLKDWFPEPENFDDWHFVTQLNQARAIAFGIEHMRSHKPVCMGSIVWQLNDCWPVTSWSAIDGYGRKKPLWYALRNSYAPHLVTIQPRDGGLSVIAVNDTTLFWRVPFSIERIDFDGNVLARHAVWRVLCDRFEKIELTIPADVATPGDPTRELLRARIGQSETIHFFEKDERLDYPARKFDINARPEEDGTTVTIHAKTLLRDICFFPDRVDPNAEIDEMLVTLLPGEGTKFRIRHTGEISLDQLRTNLRCANDLFHPSL
jgi:beta-mannosidase